MASTIQTVIDEIGPMKVLGICTDNATNMKKAWDILQNTNAHIQSYGCLAHTLHLAFTDVSKIKSVEGVQRDCTSIVKTIKRSQKLTALLKQQQQQSPQHSQVSLKLPVATR